jgi:MFS family permease
MCKLPHLLQRRKKMGQRTITVVAEEKRGGPLNTGIPEKHAVVRNTVLLSAGMAALYGMNQLTVAVATTTFALVSDRDGLAGIGPAIFLVTAAFGAFVAGRAMDRFGRVPVLAGGFGLGILGCVLTGFGTSLLSVVAVIGGFFLIGASVGTVMLSRAAAADMYPPDRRGRGIALVLFGAVFGALLGPLVFAPIFAGEGPEGSHLMTPWLVAAGFMVVGLVLVLNVRPDPQRIGALLARQARQGHTRSPQRGGASLTQILRRPGVVSALLAAVASFSVMVGTMALTGHVLVGHGHHQAAVFPVISAHFVGMFGLSLVVGNVIDRVGRIRALLGGLLLLGFSVLSLVWTVESIAATSVALFGIGLGWNFSYVAATAELTERTVSAERGKILGFTDLLSGLLGASLALLGGVGLVTTGLVGLSVAGLVLVVSPACWILHTAQNQKG